MGFTPKSTEYKLVFADPDMAGLEVITTSPSMGVFIDLTALASLDPADPEALSRLSEVDKMFSHFAESLISWNLEDKHKNPIPPTKEGLYTQKLDFILVVIQAWVQATASVSAPLSKGSSVGGPSPVASIPMETLSPSLAS